MKFNGSRALTHRSSFYICFYNPTASRRRENTSGYAFEAPDKLRTHSTLEIPPRKAVWFRSKRKEAPNDCSVSCGSRFPTHSSMRWRFPSKERSENVEGSGQTSIASGIQPIWHRNESPVGIRQCKSQEKVKRATKRYVELASQHQGVENGAPDANPHTLTYNLRSWTVPTVRTAAKACEICNGMALTPFSKLR